jgi:hypothetical protein
MKIAFVIAITTTLVTMYISDPALALGGVFGLIYCLFQTDLWQDL